MEPNRNDGTPKPNWIQRRMIKKLFKKMNKKLNLWKTKDETPEQTKTKLITAITNLQTDLSITNEKGEELTYLMMKEMNNEDLIEILEMAIKQGEKYI